MGCTLSKSRAHERKRSLRFIKNLVYQFIGDKWDLNEESLSFLLKLNEANREAFHEFMLRLKELSKSNLLLKAN